MSLNFWNAFVGNALPEDLAGRFIESVNLPRVLRVFFDRRGVAEQTKARFVFATAHRSDHEHLVAPNDWAGVRESGNRSFPTDIFRFRRVKLRRFRETFIDTRGTWPTKLRPVLCLRRSYTNCEKSE